MPTWSKFNLVVLATLNFMILHILRHMPEQNGVSTHMYKSQQDSKSSHSRRSLPSQPPSKIIVQMKTTDRRTFMDKTTPAYTGNYDVDHNSISKHKSKKKRRGLLVLKIPNDDLGKN